MGGENRMVVLKGIAELKTFMRCQRRGGITLAYLDRFQYAQELFLGWLVNNARRLQQEHEGRSAAIHDGQFSAVNFDGDIVDP